MPNDIHGGNHESQIFPNMDIDLSNHLLRQETLQYSFLYDRQPPHTHTSETLCAPLQRCKLPEPWQASTWLD